MQREIEKNLCIFYFFFYFCFLFLFLSFCILSVFEFYDLIV